MSVALDIVRCFDSSKNIFFDAFILARLIKIQPYYFPAFVKFKQYFIHSAVGYCAAYITVCRCNFAVAVIKALGKIFCPAYVKDFILVNPEIYTGGCRRVYMKSTLLPLSALHIALKSILCAAGKIPLEYALYIVLDGE